MRPPFRRALGLALLLGGGTAVAASFPGLEVGYSPISEQTLLISDNQFHHLLGEPGWIRIQLSDELVGTAVRPVALDLYAQALFRRTLADYTANALLEGAPLRVVHLGDALDVACSSEWERFLEEMGRVEALGGSWAMAPGNHDAYFYGLAHRGGVWREGCREPGDGRDEDRRMTKDRLVTRLAEALKAQQGSFVRRVEAEAVELRPWRSFVLSQVDLSREGEKVYGVLLDTTQYARRPRLSGPVLPNPNAGLDGEILEDQQALVRAWVAEQPDARWIFFGHHPLDALSEPTRAFVSELAGEGAGLYVSAHTHAGFVRQHGSGAGELVELNVGSISDFPNEVRLLQVFEGGRGELAFHSPRMTGQEHFATSRFGPTEAGSWIPRCEDDWLIEGADHLASEFTTASGVAPAKMRDATLDAVLEHHADEIRGFKAARGDACAMPAGARNDRELLKEIELWKVALRGDEKAARLVELEDYLACRSPRAGDARELEAFAVCRALHAARMDAMGGELLPEDTWFHP